MKKEFEDLKARNFKRKAKADAAAAGKKAPEEQKQTD